MTRSDEGACSSTNSKETKLWLFFKEKKKTLLTLVVNMAFNVLLNNTDVGIIIYVINNDFN